MVRQIILHEEFEESGVVTLTSNAASTLTPIIDVKVPKARSYIFRDGFPLILKLEDETGAEIGSGSSIVHGVRRPNDQNPSDVTGTATYSAWRNIPLSASAGEKTQYDAETTARRTVEYNDGKDVVLPQDWHYVISLRSSSVVKWPTAAQTAGNAAAAAVDADSESHFELEVLETEGQTVFVA